MMIEHYTTETLALSRRLYEQISEWGRARDDVSLIGGWAVFESVLPERAQQSRDVDLVMHTEEALQSFSRRLADWGLTWRRHGRNVFNDCHLIADERKEIVVDVLKSHPFPERVFTGMRMRRANPVKPLPQYGWLPPLSFLIEDKVRTVPLRFRDADDKRLKDLIDIHNLVYFNREGGIPDELVSHLEPSALATLRPLLERARQHDARTRGGAYNEELDRLDRLFFSV